MSNSIPSRYRDGLRLAEAQRVMTAAESEAGLRQWPVAIAIVDSGGHLVMLHRADDVQLGSIKVAISKAESALLFRRPTAAFQEMFSRESTGSRYLTVPGFIPIAGGVPLMAEGAVFGAIGVSGMQSDEDALVANVGAAAFQLSS